MTTSNRKAVGVCETTTAIKNANNKMNFNEKLPACHPAPIVYVVSMRSASGVWMLHFKQCPYCNGPHWHGGGDGERPLLGHRVTHCAVGTPGYILEEGQ